MEDEPKAVKQTKENGKAASSWVLRPETPSGTSIELSILSKADHPTPEMLELLQRLMVRAQESRTAEELRSTPPDCPKLQRCGTYTLV
ncbi:hypothetical protein [Bradyrhizobium sp. AUGA SZCCT0283]|uniref:hypothetical protein n=1 Tax=Bradyrhizobium sp. AUGA SZCCT0283 TaxID=2807671 RepID=UPI001BA49082|nr:hypothetical protein [Bradyrhizobium sp. AUGA SZCCT0283]MBR1280205.1 hypothetical protein [Bradyrhizobium sp. AUGA SZCCT0283]